MINTDEKEAALQSDTATGTADDSVVAKDPMSKDFDEDHDSEDDDDSDDDDSDEDDDEDIEVE